MRQTGCPAAAIPACFSPTSTSRQDNTHAPHFVIPAELVPDPDRGAGIHITIINRTRNGIPRGSPGPLTGQAQGPVPTRRIGVGTIPPWLSKPSPDPAEYHSPADRGVSETRAPARRRAGGGTPITPPPLISSFPRKRESTLRSSTALVTASPMVPPDRHSAPRSRPALGLIGGRGQALSGRP